MELTSSDGRMKMDATKAEEKKYESLFVQKSKIKASIDSIMNDIEDKVLDSELFLREAKQYFLLPEHKDSTSR